MKTSLRISSGLAAVAVAGAANAADLSAPIYKAPPPAPSGYNWTGFYVGLNAGGAWGSSAITTTLNPTPNPPNNAAVAAADSPTVNSSGFTGGIEAGYNWQLGRFVLGVEADFDYLGLKGSQSGGGAFPVGAGTFATSNSVQTSWLFTARPRVGVLFGGLLLYGTGGLAVTDPQFNSAKTDTFAQNEAASFSTTRVGWTIGGGGEYALGNGWSLKAEYLYADFGSVSVAGFEPLPGGGITFTHNVPLTTNIVRGGINFKF